MTPPPPAVPPAATRKAASVPGAPTLTAAALNYGRIELSWTAPAANGGDDIDSYRIEIVNSQGVWATEATLPSSRTTYTDSGLTRATEYLYRIHARNAAGEGPAGSASAVTLANQPERRRPRPVVSAVAGSWQGQSCVGCARFQRRRADPRLRVPIQG